MPGLMMTSNPFLRQHLVMALVSWLGMGWLVAFVDPSYVMNVGWPNSYLPFFGLFGAGWFWLLMALSNRWKRSLLWAGSITCWLWLRSAMLDTVSTVLLLVTFNLIWAYYWKISKI